MSDAISKVVMEMAPEAIREMASLPTRLYSGQGGEYLVLLEGFILIAIGPQHGPPHCRHDIPREEDKTADEISPPQTTPSSAAPTQAT